MVACGLDGKYQGINDGHDELSCSLIEDILHIEECIAYGRHTLTVKNTAEVFGKQMVHLGGEILPFHFDGLDLEVSPRSFFQLNTAQARCYAND